MIEIKLYEMLGRQLAEIQCLRDRCDEMRIDMARSDKAVISAGKHLEELNALKRELKGFAGEPDDVVKLRASLRKFEGIAAERDEALFQLDGLRERLETEKRMAMLRGDVDGHQ